MNKQRILSAWAARLSLLLCDCVVIAIGIMALWGILTGALSPFSLLIAVPCLVSGIAAGAMHSSGRFLREVYTSAAPNRRRGDFPPD